MTGKPDEENQTNLQLLKVGRSGRVVVAGEDDAKNKDAAAFKRLMAKMQEEARPPGYLFGRGALDHDDIQYLKEQNQAEEDASRLRDQSERRAFAAFKAAALATDAAAAGPGAAAGGPALVSPRLKVEAKQKTGIKQAVLLQRIVAVKPKKSKQGSLTRSLSGSESQSQAETPKGASAAHSESQSLSGGEKRPRLDASLSVSSPALDGLIDGGNIRPALSSGDVANARALPAARGLADDEAKDRGAQEGLTGSSPSDASRPILSHSCASVSAGIEPRLPNPGAATGTLLGLAYDDSDDDGDD